MEKKGKKTLKAVAFALCLFASGCAGKSDDSSTAKTSGLDSVAEEKALYTTSEGSGIGRNVAETDEGFYWLKRFKDERPTLIMFYDSKTETASVLCNKPSCSHEDYQCAAALSGDWNCIYYYNNSLYFVADKMIFEDDQWIVDDSYVLWKANANGENRKQLYKINTFEGAEVDNSDAQLQSSVDCKGFINGYLFVRIAAAAMDASADGEAVLAEADRLLAFPIDGKSEDVVVLADYSENEDDGQEENKSAAGGGKNILLTAAGKNIYMLDQTSGAVKLLSNYAEKSVDVSETEGMDGAANINGAAVIDGVLYYYENDKGICRLKIGEKNPEIIVEKDDLPEGTPSMLWNENGIVAEQFAAGEEITTTIRIYDLDGNALTEPISLSGMDAVWDWSDFGLFIEDRSTGTYYITDVDKLKKGSEGLNVIG